MTAESRSAWRGAVVLIAAGVALRLLLLYWARGTMVDDAYITTRYSLNLVEGLGLVYNEGVRALGVTTPLYAFWAAALLLVVPAAHIGYALGLANIAAFALAALGLLRLADEVGGRTMALVVLVLALYLPFVDNSTIGMETPLFLLGIAWSLVLFRQRRFAWVSLLAGLLILVRPEGVLWALSLGLVLAVRRERPSPRDLLPGVAVLVAWVAFSVPYYGSPIPQSLTAKTGWVVPAAAESALGRITTTFASLALLELPPRLAGTAVGQVAWWAIAVATAALFVIGARVLYRRRSVLLSFPVLFLLYMVFYLVGRGRVDFSWYGIPSGLAYLTTVFVGLAALARRLLSVRLRVRGLAVAAPVLVLALLGSSVVVWRATRLPYTRLLRESYGAAGEYVDRHAAPDARVFLDETGMIGWRARRHVHELSGIISAEVTASFARAGWKLDLADLVREYEPEFLVFNGYHLEWLTTRGDAEWVGEHYEIVAEFSNHTVLEKVK